jgi:hypothetical protein
MPEFRDISHVHRPHPEDSGNEHAQAGQIFLPDLFRHHVRLGRLPDAARQSCMSRMTRISWLQALLALVALSAANSAFGWIYPEHREIAIEAVQGLDAGRRAEFDRLWQDARVGDEQRLCAQGANTGQGKTPNCIDWAALSAIGGDHSCSSQEMLQTVRKSDWILDVARIAAHLKAELAKYPVTAPDRAQADGGLIADVQRRFASETQRAARLNALRTADSQMQRADSRYSTRANANFAHFLLARPDTNLDPYAYAQLTLQPGSDLNAIGVWLTFHLNALMKASRVAKEKLAPDERRDLVRAALFDEGFALHFLEDAFASGHVAGTWGDVSQRIGTHDYYNQHGLEVFTWEGRDKTVVLMGDAYMRPQDAELAADTVRKSLEQVLDAAAGHSRGYEFPYSPTAGDAPDDFDVCKNLTFPQQPRLVAQTDRIKPAAKEVLFSTPVPGLGPGLGAMPRFTSEVGTFAGLVGSVDGRWISGGFDPSQSDNGWIGGIEVGVRAGLGLEGTLGDAGDGLVFGQLGLRADTNSTNRAVGTALGQLSGGLSAAIPARTAVSTRFRLPFYLVPGDLVFLSPMLLFDSTRTAYQRMAVTAANGGLIPWQQGLATPIGRFQFVLGRELGVTWYGLGRKQEVLVPSEPPGGPGRVVDYKSTYLDVPILEYRPYRSFGAHQSSSILFQLFAGADVPYHEVVEYPEGAPPANLHTVYSVGLRMTFDWRYYY